GVGFPAIDLRVLLPVSVRRTGLPASVPSPFMVLGEHELNLTLDHRDCRDRYRNFIGLDTRIEYPIHCLLQHVNPRPLGTAGCLLARRAKPDDPREYHPPSA